MIDSSLWHCNIWFLLFCFAAVLKVLEGSGSTHVKRSKLLASPLTILELTKTKNGVWVWKKGQIQEEPMYRRRRCNHSEWEKSSSVVGGKGQKDRGNRQYINGGHTFYSYHTLRLKNGDVFWWKGQKEASYRRFRIREYIFVLRISIKWWFIFIFDLDLLVHLGNKDYRFKNMMDWTFVSLCLASTNHYFTV